MKVTKTFIQDLYIIENDVFHDDRGWFSEVYSNMKFEIQNLDFSFKQLNHSYSKLKGTLRGLHFQKPPYEQAKLVRVLKGRILDVAVDLRESSATYLKWFSIELSDLNKLQILIPKGFAHGFISLEDNTEIEYFCDNYYNKEADAGIRFDDEFINIQWPKMEYIISEKDKNLPRFRQNDKI